MISFSRLMNSKSRFIRSKKMIFRIRLRNNRNSFTIIILSLKKIFKTRLRRSLRITVTVTT